MLPATTYDITRLVTRVFNVTPNGIDRVDSAFARHFLAVASTSERFGTVWTPFGPRMMPAKAARAAIEGIDSHWGEALTGETDPVYGDVVARLGGGGSDGAIGQHRIARGRSGRLGAVARWFAQNGLPLGRTPERDLPHGARYVNVSQFPLWVASYFEWLERRRDVKAVFFVHDLLPLEMPEYFRFAEEERHRRRMANVARFAAGAIVTTAVVKEALTDHLLRLGRSNVPILVAPTPMSPVFFGRRDADPALGGAPYFVICSTIEPRKNHMMLLNVWRELVRRDGASAPRLVVIGNRGWKFGAVIDMLERCPAMRSHVIEVSGLSTPGLRRLLDGARALLMPTFGEGYGLPVHEALAAGVPAIVSDIPAFRDFASPLLTRLSPIDGEAWLSAIRSAAARTSRTDDPLPATSIATTWSSYFGAVDSFVAEL